MPEEDYQDWGQHIMGETSIGASIFLGLLCLTVITVLKIGISETVRWRRGENIITKAQAGLRIITIAIMVLLGIFIFIGIKGEGWFKLLSFLIALVLALLLIPIAFLDIKEVRKKLRQQQKELFYDLSKVSTQSFAAHKKNEYYNENYLN